MAEDISVDAHVAEVSEVREADLTSEEFVPEFNVVMVTNWKGEVIEVRVEEPMQGFDPEAQAKVAAMTAWVARNLATMLDEEGVHEIDIVMGKKLMVLMPDSDGVRIGITSAV